MCLYEVGSEEERFPDRTRGLNDVGKEGKEVEVQRESLDRSVFKKDLSIYKVKDN